MPPVLVTAQPKNGTHLIMETLGLIPGMKPSPLTDIVWSREKREASLQKLYSIRKGEFAKAHLIYNSAVEKPVKENNIRVFNMIRDPRDNLVSHVFYLKKNTRHRLHPYIMSLEDDSARLMAMIKGFQFHNGKKTLNTNPAKTPLMNWLNWFNCKNCLTITFENLVGEKGGGSKVLQQEEIKKILQHLDVTINEDLVTNIAENCYNTDSPTFRRGLIGDWKNFFTVEHKEELKQQCNDYLVHFGYEKDDSW